MNPDEINEVLDYSYDIFDSDDGFSVFDDADDDPDFRIGLVSNFYTQFFFILNFYTL
jgi:hypothetical protein